MPLVQEFALAKNTNFRDMRGKLIAVRPNPQAPLEYGNMVMINDILHIVKGICVVNGKFNVNVEATSDSK